MTLFRYIAKHGNHGFHHQELSQNVRDGVIVCQDGFAMRVKAGQDIGCNPTVTPCGPDSDHPTKSFGYHEDCKYPGPYENFLVDKLSEVPPNFSAWLNYGYADEPKGPFYYVPKSLVEELIAHHGGELG
jgi:hypothetical protein